MPELPEVEFCGRRLRAQAVGRRILAVVGHPLPVVGRQVVAVRRVGKQLVVDLDVGHLLLHLGMTGKVLHRRVGDEVRSATRAQLTLDDGHRLDFVDPRRFGKLAAVDGVTLASVLARLGPDVLEITGDPPALAARFRGCRQAIKVALLDQARIAGAGNIYAAEALFLAGVHPLTPAGDLGAAAWVALAAGLEKTMRDSLARETGEEIIYLQEGAPSPFFVYAREGEACMRCGTPIVRTAQQGRSTFWCPSCQKAG